VIPIYFLAVKRSGGLFLDRSDLVYEAAGGAALALVLALLFGSFGGQTLYPRESVMGMWAAVGIAWRLSVERAEGRGFGEASGDEDDEDSSVESGERDPELVDADAAVVLRPL